MPIDVTSQYIDMLILKELQVFADLCFATQRIANNTASRSPTSMFLEKLQSNIFFKFLIALYTFVISCSFEI